ncbi:MAG: hypothetical protein ACRDLQ_07355 [Solirubrobacterales bacterium]
MESPGGCTTSTGRSQWCTTADETLISDGSARRLADTTSATGVHTDTTIAGLTANRRPALSTAARAGADPS